MASVAVDEMDVVEALLGRDGSESGRVNGVMVRVENVEREEPEDDVEGVGEGERSVGVEVEVEGTGIGDCANRSLRARSWRQAIFF